MWKGIDVSDNQGVIDWAQVAASKVAFAILRSVRRSGKEDNQFAANLEGCRKHNIPLSVYKYTYAATPEAARQEAQQVVDLLRSHSLTGTMVWWDVEDKDVLRPLGSQNLTECIRAAQDVITTAGYGFGLYIGLYVYKERWFDFNAFAGTRLWIARYYRGYRTMQFDDEPDQKYKPNVDGDISVWQYTSCGEIPGIMGDADLDIAYDDPAEWTHPAAEPGVIYTVSVADVWTREQAEVIRQQFAAMGINGIVHKVKILE